MNIDELYNRAAPYVDNVSVVDLHIRDVYNYIRAAINHAENGNSLAVSAELGHADDALRHLMAAWKVIKDNDINNIRSEDGQM